MCLIDRVIEHDENHIVCESSSHRSPHNPLRNGDRLNTITAVEYAAQATGIWLGLHRGDAAKPQVGYVVALRDVRIHRERLDDAGETLMVDVSKKLFGEHSAICEFSVRVDGAPVLNGQLTLLTQDQS